MTHRLRLLIEIDGAAAVDRDMVVRECRIDQRNDVTAEPSTALYGLQGLTGWHDIVIRYQDVLSPTGKQ